MRTMIAAVRRPQRLARDLVQGVRDVSATRSILLPSPANSLNGPIGPHRRWAWARGRLADVKTIREAFGGTVNDVVLAVITAGFRDLLKGRGEDVEGRTVRTLVPVSVRKGSEQGSYDNRVSGMFAELPIGIADPVERLNAVRQQMEDLKQSRQAVGAEVLTSMTGFAPALLLALGARVAMRVPQRNLNTVTTNVPGPQHPLYLAGRRLLEVFPFVPLASNVRVGVAIYSYDGGLNFGVTGDYDSAPDVGVLGDGIERALGELAELAQGSRPKPARLRAAKRGASTAGRAEPATAPGTPDAKT
jgi:WS/DGAT/MGAT family acyltransferase